MSPTVRHGARPPVDTAVVTASSTRAATVYAAVLLTLAIALVVGVAVTGARWPSPALVLLLAVPLAWCMNRYVLFPNELGVTADAAVIVAAMLVCRDDAPWLGPLLVALLVGVLDRRHWEERSFERMAYNSGSTALVAAATLVVFSALVDAWGTSWTALLGAALVAVIPYAVVEAGFGVVLVTLLGERPRAAVRQQVPLNAAALPLAVLGALAGLAGVELGWWAALLLLIPAPFVPELLIITLPRRTTAAARWLTVTALALAGSALAPSSTTRGVAGLVAVTALVLADRRPGRPGRCTGPPPLLAVVATVPLAAFPVGLSTPTVAVLVAAGIGAVVLALVTAGRATMWWNLPVVLLAAPAARLWAITGRAGAVVFVAVLSAALVLAVRFGPAPWPSRLLVRVRARPSTLAVWMLGGLALACSVAAVVVTGSARRDLAVLTVVALEAMVVVGAFAVRLWRFAPRRRVRELVLLLAVGVAALVGVLPLADWGSLLAPCATAIGAAVAAHLAGVAAHVERDSTPW